MELKSIQLQANYNSKLIPEQLKYLFAHSLARTHIRSHFGIEYPKIEIKFSLYLSLSLRTTCSWCDKVKEKFRGSGDECLFHFDCNLLKFRIKLLPKLNYKL